MQMYDHSKCKDDVHTIYTNYRMSFLQIQNQGLCMYYIRYYSYHPPDRVEHTLHHTKARTLHENSKLALFHIKMPSRKMNRMKTRISLHTHTHSQKYVALAQSSSDRHRNTLSTTRRLSPRPQQSQHTHTPFPNASCAKRKL